MKFTLDHASEIGRLLAGPSGIQELMDDCGQALTSCPEMRMLGGGQPAAIPEVQTLWRERFTQLLAEPILLDKALLNYDPPAGNPLFREAMAGFLRKECGWRVKSENIAVVPSSQAGFFLLFNLLSGVADGGATKRMVFPLLPEYIGYANQALTPGQFQAYLPRIEKRAEHEFKYALDQERFQITEKDAGVCFSCPTNPTGNVLTEMEFAFLKDRCEQAGIPLIVDNAYGHPFPGVLHGAWRPQWEPGMIFSISLSKLGLPGVRTAVMVADASVVKALANMNAIVSLANGNLGQAILTPLLADDRLICLGRDVIRPYYHARSEQAKAWLTHEMGGSFPWYLHAQEGAFFLWLWIPGLPVRAAELYQRLKKRNVLVIPGHYFSFGLQEPWSHTDECLRLTYSQPWPIVKEGLSILADEIRQLMRA